MIKFGYFEQELSKEEALRQEFDQEKEFPDMITAVKQGRVHIDGKHYKTGLMLKEDGTPTMWYFFNYKINEVRAQGIDDADST